MSSDKLPFYQFKVDIPAHWKEPKYKDLWNVCLDCKEILRQSVPYANTWTQNINIATSLHNIVRLQVSHSLEINKNTEILLTEQRYIETANAWEANGSTRIIGAM